MLKFRAWLPDTSEIGQCILTEFDYLIKKEAHHPEDSETSKPDPEVYVVNECTKKEVLALGDSNLRNLRRGELRGKCMVLLSSKNHGYYLLNALALSQFDHFLLPMESVH